MRNLSATDVLRIYLASSVCAAQITSHQSGFRAKDVRFFTDLFGNWMECYLGQSHLLQNTQIRRYLKELISQNVIEENSEGIYVCKKRGFLELLETITTVRDSDPLEQFFYQYHILDIYQNLLFTEVAKERLFFTKSFEIDLKYLLDKKALIQKQRTRLEKIIEKLNIRRIETLEMSKIAEKIFKAGGDTLKAVEVIEKTVPYQLNNQVSMTALFNKLPQGLQKAELTHNAILRATKLWSPLQNHYELYLKRLDDLEKGS